MQWLSGSVTQWFSGSVGFAQKVEIDEARRILRVDSASQPAERATAFTVILGCRPLPRAAVLRSAVDFLAARLFVQSRFSVLVGFAQKRQSAQEGRNLHKGALVGTKRKRPRPLGLSRVFSSSSGRCYAHLTLPRCGYVPKKQDVPSDAAASAKRLLPFCSHEVYPDAAYSLSEMRLPLLVPAVEILAQARPKVWLT